ncbi:hypothetical protein [Dictyobacter arantiisoli]|uniref:Uncharacterized protein n=1 Tax=Dictyobacter arantiisoli TaxID=2014874 RepID=A0A5A5TKU7_9CHLR|nr:hypothetical protein [Dictyobacter arantiisoli]GCF11673.1 hypothetical protein KDI_52370 [Dictyobacter arantiisoli]
MPRPKARSVQSQTSSNSQGMSQQNKAIPITAPPETLIDTKEENKKREEQEAIPPIDYNQLAMALQGIIQYISEEKEPLAANMNEPPKLILLPNNESP